jgi:hypothetical protein
MTRSLYQLLLWLHPPFFRERFGDEMLWIYDEAAATHGVLALFTDGFASLARQWVMRAGAWKLAAAGAGGLLEILVAGFFIMGPAPQTHVATRSSIENDPAQFSGTWKGSLRSRPIELVLAKEGAVWRGEIHFQSQDGAMRSAPLEDIRVAGDSVHLRVKVDDADITFNGKLVPGTLGSRLVGALHATADANDDLISDNRTIRGIRELNLARAGTGAVSLVSKQLGLSKQPVSLSKSLKALHA